MRHLALTFIAIFLALSHSRAADSTIINLTTLTALNAADSFVVVDASDTTQSAQGTTKDITALNIGAFYITDTGFPTTFDGVTDKAVSKDDFYDYAILFDTDTDGKVNVLDAISAAGIPYTNSSGAVLGTRSIAEGAAIDVTNGDASGGNPTVAFDSTEIEATTYGAGGNASNLWTFNLTGTDPVITFSSGAVNVSTGTLQQGGVDVLTTSGSQVVSTKTIDAASNTVKMKSLPQFISPMLVQGTNVTIGATATSIGYGLAIYSNEIDQNTNYAQWRFIVPADWDTTVDPRVKVVDMLGGADTSTRRYVFGVASVATSALANTATGTAINVDFSADGTGASGDVAISSTTTLTGWGAAVTPGQMMTITVARDGDAAQDASSFDSTLIAFELEYGVTQ